MSDRLIKAAKAVVDAIDFDNNGRRVGSVFQGGNGGLYSLDTLKAADELRRAINEMERAA